jgi:hypothetical protein
VGGGLAGHRHGVGRRAGRHHHIARRAQFGRRGAQAHAVLTSAQPERYHIRPISQPELQSRLYLATASGRITTLTQQAMLDLIRATVREAYPAAMIQTE